MRNALILAVIGLLGCKTTSASKVKDASAGGTVPDSSGVPVVTDSPWTLPQGSAPLAKDQVVAAICGASKLWMSTPLMSNGRPAPTLSKTLTRSCFNGRPPYWSELMMLYYCQHPVSDPELNGGFAGSPSSELSVRGCFSALTRCIINPENLPLTPMPEGIRKGVGCDYIKAANFCNNAMSVQTPNLPLMTAFQSLQSPPANQTLVARDSTIPSGTPVDPNDPNSVLIADATGTLQSVAKTVAVPTRVSDGSDSVLMFKYIMLSQVVDPNLGGDPTFGTYAKLGLPYPDAAANPRFVQDDVDYVFANTVGGTFGQQTGSGCPDGTRVVGGL